MKVSFRGLVVALAALAVNAQAQSPTPGSPGEWEGVVEGPPITVKHRPIEGLKVKELYAEGDMDAPVRDVQAALLAADTYWKFMPYVKESRFLDEKADAEGFRHTYALVDTPVVGRRDYAIKTRVLEEVKPDGSGSFRNSFAADPEALKERSGVIRIRLDEGSWEVTPSEDGTKSHAVYRLLCDPGGWIPAFAANLGTRKGLPDTFKAVEKEAQRRRDERFAELKKAPAQAALTPAPPAVPLGTAAPSVAPAPLAP